MTNTEDQTDYIEQVGDRARKLIQTGVWAGIQEHRLDNWLGCFENHSAGLLGAYLLDNLCYRSQNQFLSLLDALFVDLKDHSGGQHKRLISLLETRPKNKNALSTCIVPVLAASSPPTKSSPYVLRLAQRRYGMHSDWFLPPHLVQTTPSLQQVIFVDDFCGTGTQFTEFTEDIGLKMLHAASPHLHVSYLVATAHEVGIQKINDELPFIKIFCAEQLTAVHSVLGDESFARYKIENFQDLVLEQYHNVIKISGLPGQGKLSAGFGKLGLAYAFSHATPNNSLPVFWYDTPQWTPLLNR